MSRKNTIVTALAGTGKTFTLIEGMKRMMTGKGTPGVVGSPQQEAVWDAFGSIADQPAGDGQGVMFVAFNKSIADELSRKVPFGTQASTLHAFGNGIVKKAFPDKLKGFKAVNAYRTQNLAEKLYGVDFREERKTARIVWWNQVFSLVGLCKQTLSDGSEDSLYGLVDHYGAEVENEGFVFPKVAELLEKSKEVTHEIDYNDMLWLPVVLGLTIPRKKVLLVDEAQDLNRCQQVLAMRSADRLIVCGDPNQSIYGFAGADPESMTRLERYLSFRDLVEAEKNGWLGAACAANGVEVLPLTVTRRCCKAVTDLAKTIVRDFDCLPEAEQGLVETLPATVARTKYAPGDMVLCRTNAPLVAEAFKLIREGVPCRIQGRDFGKTLTAFTRKLMKRANIEDTDGTAELAAEAESWRVSELARLGAMKNVSESRLDMVRDQADCVIDACENERTAGGILSKFDRLFSDDGEGNGKVVLSSAHRSKGLEADSVFILRPDLLPLQRRKQQPWEKQQERNLQYVAYTRAKQRLTFCDSGEEQEKEKTEAA